MLSPNASQLTRIPHRGRCGNMSFAGPGMTLMEVLVVLALLLVAMAAVVPNLMRIQERDSVNRAIGRVGSALGKARTMAIDSSSICLFRCFPGESDYEVLTVPQASGSLRAEGNQDRDDGLRFMLQGELAGDFRFVSSEPLTRGTGGFIGIYCFPDGTATSQLFGIAERSGRRHWIRVDALTGQLSIDVSNTDSSRGS